MLSEKALGTAAIVRLVGISGSAWTRERDGLVQFGLLRCEDRRIMGERGIKRVKFHELTQKGAEVALELQTISMTLASRGPEELTPRSSHVYERAPFPKM